ncbi:hypothetical protein W97_01922 [Coniosporium apollinis CBS 100218]|uniref:Rho-GAP domain-containing protein n=1 Tax=Coniosporium apollinis (strain CBS 100218) TaxID=1168221 RepID=R7YLE8_CONA1|nr:uncharacterized protein W97_01922 [Coniosporium apollinis CBS 100218]EON62698.1 hypothetical protein W97_01922 [Coniosporium apollinis CBS 100218]
MRAQIVQRLRGSSLSAVPPPRASSDYSTGLASAAASILYRSPLPSRSGLPIYILNAAAFPDSQEADYDALLPYVLARLPGEDELINGREYEVVFLAGGNPESATSQRKSRPGWGWFVQAYHVLSRAMRKRLQKLYIVHERSWVRVLVEMFSTIVSPKFRRKIVHVSTLSALALHLPIEDLLIPPSAYLHDRRLSPDIHAPYASGRRAFAVKQPFPTSSDGQTRLPRVLRETTTFVLMEPNIRTEGLFRIPPHAKLKGILREAYDRGQKFIIWKDNHVTFCAPVSQPSVDVASVIDEVDTRDAYSVPLAAGLIKSWYAELREPLFPHSAYRDLKNQFGNPQELPTFDSLIGLISPSSEWSCLPSLSREIMVRHLLPLLSIVASYEEHSKMTPQNLAVCFAPALLCGPDQLEDAKTSSILRRILTAAIEYWPSGLRDACGVAENALWKDLQPPANPADYEDPLEDARGSSAQEREKSAVDSVHEQFTGIVLEDNDSPVQAQMPPPLPPRPRASEDTEPAASLSRWPQNPMSEPSSPLTADEGATKRKPAPPVMVPPRYSTIMAEDTDSMAESPTSYAGVADGFAPPRRSGWSLDEKKTDMNNAEGGTTSSPLSHHFSSATSPESSPQLFMPKRKALTAEQIGNAEPNIPASTTRQQQSFSAAVRAVSGMIDVHGPLGSLKSTDRAVGSPELTDTARKLVRPSRIRRSSSWSSSPSSRSIWPVQPLHSPPPPVPVTAHPSSPPSTPPSLSTKNAVLPSREPQQPPESDGQARKLSLGKLVLRKPPVDDLRRLYEERAGAVKRLAGMGRKRG